MLSSSNTQTSTYTKAGICVVFIPRGRTAIIDLRFWNSVAFLLGKNLNRRGGTHCLFVNDRAISFGIDFGPTWE